MSGFERSVPPSNLHGGEFDEFQVTDRLPSPPGLCLALVGLATSSPGSRDEILDSIRADPALAGRLIRHANRARQDGDPALTTVGAAADALDLDVVRNVVLSFTPRSRARGAGCRVFDYERFWLESIACAASCEALARRFGTFDPEEAFTLGLVCRIGLLAIATAHPDELARILESAPGNAEALHPDEDLEDAEIRVLGFDHWQVSAHVMVDWGLPSHFVDPVRALSRSAGAVSTSAAGGSGHALLASALSLSREIVRSRIGGRGAPDGASAATGGRSSVLRTVEASPDLRAVCAETTRRWNQLLHGCGLQDLLRSRRTDQGGAETGQPLSVDSTQESGSRPAAGPAPEPESAPKAPCRILVVDDDPSARHLIELHLRRAGYEVTSAPDGQSGLAMALTEAPHMVITDWLMPGLNGLDLCKALRRVDVGRRIYVLILTSREDEDNVVEGLEAGANDYLTKPFNPRILLARVNAGQRVIELQRQVETDKLIDRRRVAQLAQLSRRLRAVAMLDALTQLPNRRFALERLGEAWEASVRDDRPLSVVMIDIDHFKQINDRYGHQTGDAVLASTAEKLREACRRSDVVCRLGGEEFLVICSNSQQEDAAACAERLRVAVEGNPIVAPGFEGGMTVSLGVAERTGDMHGIDDLIAAADQAVYGAKSMGRNRVRIHSPPGPESRVA